MASQNWLVLFSLTRLHFFSSEGVVLKNIDINTENLIQYLYLLISVAIV